METRPRTRLKLRGAAVLAALGALVVPATAGAAVKTPVITKVTPKSLSVGDKLIVSGKYFRRGRGKNRVLFKRNGGKSLFVKAGLSTTKRMTVVIPAKLETFMLKRDGSPRATRFRLRVLTTKLSKRFTATKNSPLVAPKLKGTGGPGSGTGTAPVCPVSTAGDDDGDGPTSGLEQSIGTNPCAADSDGDGVTDGYEYRSAVDLNNDDYSHPTQSLPYPGKRPYPNPLDPADAGTDFDGDWLALATEYKLWRYTVANGASASLDALTYSDGLKYSIYKRDSHGRRVGNLAAAGYDKQANWENWLANSAYAMITWPDMNTPVSLLDVDRSGTVDNDPLRLAPTSVFLHSETSYYDVHGITSGAAPDGFLSDDERDEDADGLSNIDEVNYQMNPGWWKGYYSREAPFTIEFAGTDPADPDSDGDGVRDGADDQDHDDVPNFDELSRNMVTGRPFDAKDTTEAAADGSQPQGRVNPFNPCLPFTTARACPMYIPLSGGVWAPFDAIDGDDPDYLVRN
jgi:hypothetical protein